MFCPYCGANIQSDAIFCRNCGRQVGHQSTIPSSPQQQNFRNSNISDTPQGKDWTVTILLSFFLGSLGVDRFYLGYTGLGMLKLLTCGGCWVWAAIDFILVGINSMKDVNGFPLQGREGNEWLFYLLIALWIMSIFVGFVSSFLGLV